MQNAQPVADLPFTQPTAANVAPPFEFQCGDCGRIELSKDAEIPAGWDKFEYRARAVVRCDDCLEMIERNHGAGVIAETPIEPLVIDSTELRRAGGCTRRRERSCRPIGILRSRHHPNWHRRLIS